MHKQLKIILIIWIWLFDFKQLLWACTNLLWKCRITQTQPCDFLLSAFTPAVPGVQRWQVCEEDPDWGGLRVAGQSRPAQARGGLAQAACQQRSDPLIEGDPLWKRSTWEGTIRSPGCLDSTSVTLIHSCWVGGKGGLGTRQVFF